MSANQFAVLHNLQVELQALVSEREGMVAENRQREARGEGAAYGEPSFSANAQAIRELTVNASEFNS